MSESINITQGMQVYGPDERYLGNVENYQDRMIYTQGQTLPESAIERISHDRVYLKKDVVAQYFKGRQAEGEIRVPVMEEKLNVSKQTVEQGSVDIHKKVTQEQKSIPVELRREEVRVDQRNVRERTLNANEADAAFREETIRIPVRGEEAYLNKETVVTGEVVVNKAQAVERQEFTDTVRKQTVEVDENYKNYRPRFEKHFNERQNKGGRTFTEAEPNYQAGYQAGRKNKNRQFSEVEPEIRQQYKNNGQADNWETLREEVREGWNHAQS